MQSILAHPDLELIGAWVSSSQKAGRDVGELCGVTPVGVLASQDAEALIAGDADCICHAANSTGREDQVIDDCVRMLTAGRTSSTSPIRRWSTRRPRAAMSMTVCSRPAWPALEGRNLLIQRDFQHRIGLTLAQRRGLSQPDDASLVVAAITQAVMHLAFDRWAASGGRDDLRAALRTLFDLLASVKT